MNRHPVPASALLILVGALLLLFSVPNIGPSIRAGRADGKPGVFTARMTECFSHGGVHESCSWSGDFRSEDGAVRRNVSLYGAARDALKAGQSVPAIDVGRDTRVYRPDGSNEWIPTSLMLLAGTATLTLSLLRPLRPSRRAAERRGPVASSG